MARLYNKDAKFCVSIIDDSLFEKAKNVYLPHEKINFHIMLNLIVLRRRR